MKNVIFTAQVFSLLAMFPIIVLLHISHAAKEIKQTQSTMIEAQKKSQESIFNFRLSLQHSN